ncbi:MAG: alpha/beta fold hydrolase [Schwartzia sp.]|nr:alpha/beta fold hydrolase [Schwartzia sp. (in: firmicutes)]
MIQQGAGAFFLPGGTDGVLLIHGLTGSPSEMRLFGEALNKAGFTVLAVRLPGHGTTPEDMEHMTVDDWRDAVVDGWNILSAICERTAVVGISMGALLALWLSTVEPVWQVAALAAPVFIREARQLHLLPPREGCRGKFLPRIRKKMQNVPPEYGFCYRVIPFLSIHELLKMIAETKEQLSKVKTRLLVVQSERDHTVDAESARFIMEHVGSSDKKLLWLKSSGHRVMLDCERDTVFENTIAFLKTGAV